MLKRSSYHKHICSVSLKYILLESFEQAGGMLWGFPSLRRHGIAAYPDFIDSFLIAYPIGFLDLVDKLSLSLDIRYFELAIPLFSPPLRHI